MKLIAHRGLWHQSSEKNTKKAFENALENDFGIETDVRDFCGKLVISHDVPTGEELSFKEFLSLCECNQNVTLALNIKSDGLQDLLLEQNIKSPHFFFDMSVPDMIGYKSKELMYYTRFSDVEPCVSLIDCSTGIWLDNFNDGNLNLDEMSYFLNLGKKVALVSPELHGYSYDSYWVSLKYFINKNKHKENDILLCTDVPLLAKEYFDLG